MECLLRIKKNLIKRIFPKSKLYSCFHMLSLKQTEPILIKNFHFSPPLPHFRNFLFLPVVSLHVLQFYFSRWKRTYYYGMWSAYSHVCMNALLIKIFTFELMSNEIHKKCYWHLVFRLIFIIYDGGWGVVTPHAFIMRLIPTIKLLSVLFSFFFYIK